MYHFAGLRPPSDRCRARRMISGVTYRSFLLEIIKLEVLNPFPKNCGRSRSGGLIGIISMELVVALSMNGQNSAFRTTLAQPAS
jgi:hypothetical protein